MKEAGETGIKTLNAGPWGGYCLGGGRFSRKTPRLWCCKTLKEGEAESREANHLAGLLLLQ